MVADADIHVWLETSVRTTPSIIIPYVQSAVDKTIRYRMHAVRQGQSGKSELNQSGSVYALAKQPASLGRVSLTVGKNDQCYIDLTLTEDGSPIGTYHFDCRLQADTPTR